MNAKRTFARLATTRMSLVVWIVSLTLTGGCEREIRVVKYHPLLGGLDGSQAGMTVTGPGGSSSLATAHGLPDGQLVTKDPDGTRHLHAATPRHLLIHVAKTLQANDAALFVDQVLSKRVREECDRTRRDPREAFDLLVEHERDLYALFRAMPMGEATPGVMMKSVFGPDGKGGVIRLVLPERQSRDTKGNPLVWNGVDVVREMVDGRMEYRLCWFTSPGDEW
ncbi:MAG: hypothetical protein IPK69_03900 [Phycisphaerales bacterium]|nr:MAG: hypothetical protein IPK69_03900 [Phycisphaerales bacterium]